MKKKIVVAGVVLIIYVIIFYKIFDEIHSINFNQLNLDWTLIPSVLLISFGFFLNAIMYIRIIKSLGSEPESASSVIILNFLIQPVKYLPLGSIVNAISQGMAFSKLKGIKKTSAYFTPFVGLYITILGGSTIFWFVDFGRLTFGPIIHYLIGIGVILGLIIMSPPFVGYFVHFLNFITTKKKILFPNVNYNLFFKHILKAYIISLFVWIILGGGIYLVILNVLSITQLSLLSFIAIFAFASVLGYLAIIFPSGIGIREGALIFLLGFLPTPLPYIIAIISRVVWILAEMINFLIGNLLVKSILKGKFK